MHRNRTLLVAVMLTVVFAATCLMAACSSAPSYQIESVRIDAQVQTDASVRIVDHRLLASSGISGQSAVQYRQMYPHLSENQAIVVNDVRVAKANAEGMVEGDWTWLSPIEFDPAWRNGIDGGKVAEFATNSVRAYDEEEAEFYLFFNVPADGLIMLEIDYTVVNGAQIYKDAGDVTFKYIGEETGVDSHNVTYSISLPVPEGQQAVAGSNVYAWGHGPASGSFANAGATITYTDDLVRAGQYAEAHVMFPRAWLANATEPSSYIYRDEMHASWVIKSESDWQDMWRNASINDDIMSIVLCAFCLIALVAAVVVCAIFRRHPNASSALSEEIRSLAAGLHPATAIRLFNEGRPTDEEFAATVVRLRDEKVLEVRRGADGNASGCTLERASFSYVENSLDSDALSVLETLGLDGGLAAEDVQARVLGNKEAFLDAVRMWRKGADEAYAAGEFDDPRAAAWKGRMLSCGLALIALAIVFAIATSCYLACALLLVVGVGLCVISNGLPTLSQRGVDVLAALEDDSGNDGDDDDDDDELTSVVLEAVPVAFDAAQKPSDTVFKRMRSRILRTQRGQSK